MKRPGLIMTVMLVIFAVLFCTLAALAVVLARGIEYYAIIFLPIGVMLCVAEVILGIIILKKAKKRYDDAFDKILTAFSPDDVKGLRMLSDGEPSPEQISQWIAEQTAVSYKFKERSSVSSVFVEQSAELYWQISNHSCRLSKSTYWRRNYGETRLDAETDVRELLSVPTRIELGRMLKEVSRTVGSDFSISGTLELSPQQSIRVKIKGKSLYLKEYGEIAVVGTIRDMEPQAQLADNLRAERIKSAFLLHSGHDAVYEVDLTENRLVSLNPEVSKEMFGIEGMIDFETQRRPYWERVHPDYREGFIDRFFNYNHMLILPAHKITYEYRVKNRYGDYIWVEHQAQVTAYSGGVVKKVIGRISNINEAKKRETIEALQTSIDGLTGALLKSGVAKGYEKPEYKSGKRAVVLFDINGFRSINNEYGFDMGDKVLVFLVTTLWENQKGRCLVGRLDNDTFVTAMLNVTEVDTPAAQIDKVMKHFEQPVNIDGKMMNITIRAAASGVSGPDDSFEDALKQAELAMKVCKEATMPFTNGRKEYSELPPEVKAELQKEQSLS